HPGREEQRMSVMRALLLLLGTLTAAPAFAVPSPSTSHCDPILVGNSSGIDMGNTYHVVVRDLANSPVVGRPVAIWFSSSPARPDVEQEAGSTTDCAALTITRTSDATGSATFHARMGGYDNTKTVRVLASGVVLALIQVRSTDMNGDGATGGADFNAFRQRFLLDPHAPETDFNLDGITNGFDFDLFRTQFLSGVTSTVCP